MSGRLELINDKPYHIINSRAEQSRAEQSRAEQSRAEQSRAEQSRAEQSRAEQSFKHRRVIPDELIMQYLVAHRSCCRELGWSPSSSWH
ncbi:unnamed protein product [Diplocarpon coronariae]